MACTLSNDLHTFSRRVGKRIGASLGRRKSARKSKLEKAMLWSLNYSGVWHAVWGCHSAKRRPPYRTNQRPRFYQWGLLPQWLLPELLRGRMLTGLHILTRVHLTPLILQLGGRSCPRQGQICEIPSIHHGQDFLSMLGRSLSAIAPNTAWVHG